MGTQIVIDTNTLKGLIAGAVSEAMQPYAQELARHAEKMAKHAEKIAVLEKGADDSKTSCPQNCPCQMRMNTLSDQGTRNEASTKSAHHRVDSIYKVAGIVGAVAGAAASAGVTFGYVVYQASHAVQAASKVAGG